MGKARVSIGDDTATGEPDSAPPGPYITDVEDEREINHTSRSRNDTRKRDRAVARMPNALRKRPKGPAQP